MGRGGHHHSHHHHHHHHHHYGGYYGGGEAAPLWVYIVILVALITFYMMVCTARDNDIRSGDRINTQYELTEYMYDNANYFGEGKEKVISSLEYFYEQTGAQMVIVTQQEYIDDAGTEKMYYDMFDDESHVLIVLPMDGMFDENETQYYYMGDDALRVIDETGMNYMLECIDDAYEGRCNAWSREIRDITNMIME